MLFGCGKRQEDAYHVISGASRRGDGAKAVQTACPPSLPLATEKLEATTTRSENTYVVTVNGATKAFYRCEHRRHYADITGL
jgi:hypothetical protein